MSHTLLGLKLRSSILEATRSISEVLQVDRKTAVVETAFQGATTVLCTLLISLYLIFKQWQQRKLIGMEIIQIGENN
jgi:hypothetical protein